MAPNHIEFTMFTEFVRVSSVSSTVQEIKMGGKALSLTRSLMENALDVSMSNVDLSFDSSNVDATSTVILNLIQYNKITNSLTSPLERDSVSLPYQLQISYERAMSGFSFSQDLQQSNRIRVINENIKAMTNFVLETVHRDEILCNWNNELPYNVTTNCPYDKSFEVTCPGTLPGLITYECPTRNSTPTCGVLNNEGLDNLVCSVISFSLKQTVCECVNTVAISPSQLHANSVLTYSLLSTMESEITNKSISIKIK